MWGGRAHWRWRSDKWLKVRGHGGSKRKEEGCLVTGRLHGGGGEGPGEMKMEKAWNVSVSPLNGTPRGTESCMAGRLQANVSIRLGRGVGELAIWPSQEAGSRACSPKPPLVTHLPQQRLLRSVCPPGVSLQGRGCMGECVRVHVASTFPVCQALPSMQGEQTFCPGARVLGGAEFEPCLCH